MSGQEFRVTWKREGLDRRRKIYQTREGAERFVKTLRGDFPGAREEIGAGWTAPPHDPYAGVPALIEGPFIESREVGDWFSGARPEEEP